MGYSHFYAEVLRVKTVAEEVAGDKDVYVIFDELFGATMLKMPTTRLILSPRLFQKIGIVFL